jgi:uncharacterized protein YyaL (SSP411 family)
MIKGMAAAGRHLGRPEYVESATRALNFTRNALWRDGRLLATYKDGKGHLGAYLDDYAFLIDAILELLQSHWRSSDVHFACTLADVLLEHFEDAAHGGFWFTTDDHEGLIQRPKTLADEAMPSGNGIAAQALARLGFAIGETRYLNTAERTLKFAAKMIGDAPIAHASLLTALEECLMPPQIIILRGQGDAFDDWHLTCIRDYAPRRLTLAIPNDAQELPQVLADKAPQGKLVAYICEGMNCLPPVTDKKSLEAALAKTAAKT